MKVEGWGQDKMCGRLDKQHLVGVRKWKIRTHKENDVGL